MNKTLLRDICESDEFNPDHEDAIVIEYNYLARLINEHFNELNKQLEEQAKEMAKGTELMNRATASLEVKNKEIEGLKDALSDAVNGFAYIRQNHGELYGVGFDRIESHRKLLTKE